MTIFSNPPSENVDTNGRAAVQASKALNRAFKQADRTCKQITQLVNDIGRANLDAELGAEAADFETKYNLIKDFANNHPDCSVSDLPS
jgi:hypothetical protein